MRRPLELLPALLLAAACAQGAGGQELPFRVETPAFFAVQVEDVDDTGPWYSRLFLLPELASIDTEDGRYRIRILSGNGLTIEVIERRDSRAPDPDHRGLFKTGVFVDDIEAAHAWVGQQGAQPDVRIVADSLLLARTFVLRDPEGNRIQFFERCDGRC